MGHWKRMLRGVCACALGLAASAAQGQEAQTAAAPPAPQSTATGDAVVDPTVARQQAREVAKGDPSRWYRDDPTRQARMRTLQKEIGAALKEAQNACKQKPAAERSACMRDAKATWQDDMAQAKAQVDAGG